MSRTVEQANGPTTMKKNPQKSYYYFTHKSGKGRKKITFTRKITQYDKFLSHILKIS